MRASIARALLLSLLVFGGGACKKKDAEPPTPLEELGDQLLNVRVKTTPLELRIPRDWRVEDIDLSAMPEKPAAKEGEPPTVKLSGRLLFSAEAPDPDEKGGRPRLQIFHDPWLPVGTSAQDYLDAQRKENELAIKQGTAGAVSRIRHVEAERSRREGRPSYHVRDEWTLKVGSERRVVTQESLLLIDKQGDDLHGYTLVMTMTEEDLKELERLRRAVIESVRFAKD